MLATADAPYIEYKERALQALETKSMYWVDTLLLALLALGAALGFYSGLLWQIARVACLGLAIFASIACNEPVSAYLRDHLLRDADPRVIGGIAYAFVFLASYLILFLASRLIYAAIRATDLEMADRLLGGVFGSAKMALVLGACCLAAANYPNASTRALLEKSSLAPVFADGMEHVLVVIPEEYKENLRETLVSLRDLLKADKTNSPSPL